jgi:hypothetical protein
MKSLIFPDQTKISADQYFTILDVSADQTQVAYVDVDAQAHAQVLWVPNDFIVNE